MSSEIFLIDFDGTLCQTHPAIKYALATLFRRRGDSRCLETQISGSIASGSTLGETIQQLQRDNIALTDDELAAWIAEYRQIYALNAERLVKLFPGVWETLATLSARRPLVVLSNKGRDAIERSLRVFDVHRFFSLVVAEEKGLPAKPDAGVFHERIQPFFPDVGADECTVIGDTYADLLFARNIGANAVFAAYGYGHAAECEAIGYAYRIESFAELASLSDRSRPFV